jgi:ribosomal protein L10
MPKKILVKKSKVAKGEQWERLQDLCCRYSKVLFIDVDNVTSKQIAIIRRDLRAIDAHVFMGKNVSQTRQMTN